jgi:hypothetical protein
VINDPLLGPLIAAENDAARDAAVGQIVQMAEPLIEAIIARYRGMLSPEVVDDVRSAVMLRILRRLRDVPASGEAAIESVGDFVATLTFNCVNDVLRDRYPERTRLKNRIRYILTRGGRLASWRSGNDVVAGFAAWRDTPPREASSNTVLPRGDVERALIALFEREGAPLRLESVVETLAVSWGIVEVEHVPLGEVERIASPAANDLEAQEQLTTMWQEIRGLRLPQRQALLLNLRDSNSASAIELFVFLGITTIDDIAAALEMSAEDLAAIWNALPLEDNAIAARLGITRQQVINLRRAARERLARKLHNTKG